MIVSKEFPHSERHMLIIDHFPASGCALEGLIGLIRSARAAVAGRDRH